MDSTSPTLLLLWASLSVATMGQHTTSRHFRLCTGPPGTGNLSSSGLTRVRSALDCGRLCSNLDSDCGGTTSAAWLREREECCVLCIPLTSPSVPVTTLRIPGATVATITECKSWSVRTGSSDGKRCWCPLPYAGETCQRLMRDCTEGAIEQGVAQSQPGLKGIYDIQPLHSATSFKVRCHFNSDGATYPLHRKKDDSGSWAGYNWAQAREGFGDDLSIFPDTENFFMGLERLRQLARQAEYLLHVFFMLDNWSVRAGLYYHNFTLGAEDAGYPFSYSHSTADSGVANPMDNALDNQFSVSGRCYPTCRTVGGWYGAGGQGLQILSDIPTWSVNGSEKVLDLILFDLARQSAFYDTD